MEDFIAVMDSGVGGISVLKEMVRLMPNEDFLFFGDSQNAPYGTKTTKEVHDLVLSNVKRFLDEGAKAIAIACNTATSAAVADLRRIYPNIPLVGIEPALKPAAEAHPGQKIIVMATPMTIREEKFHRLLDRYADRADIIPLACPGLMEYVESGRGDSDEVEEFLRELLSPYIKESPEAIVLGCTHYPFAVKRIKNVLGNDVDIFDGGEGTARQLKRKLIEGGIQKASNGKGRVVLTNSENNPEKTALSERLLDM